MIHTRKLLPVLVSLLLIPTLDETGFGRDRGGSSGRGGGGSHSGGSRSGGVRSFSGGSRSHSSGGSRSFSGRSRSGGSGLQSRSGGSRPSATSGGRSSTSGSRSFGSSQGSSGRRGSSVRSNRSPGINRNFSHFGSGRINRGSGRSGRNRSGIYFGLSTYALPYLNRNVYPSYGPSYGQYNYYYEETPSYVIPEVRPSVEPAPEEPGSRYFAEAREAFLQGDYQQSLRMAGHAAVEMPEDPELHQFIGLTLFALEDYRGASAAAHATLAMQGKPWNWSTMQRFYARPSDYTPHLRALESERNKTPEDGQIRFLLGYHYLMLGHSKESAAQLEKAIQLLPADKQARELWESVTGKKAPTIAPLPPQQPPSAPSAPEEKQSEENSNPQGPEITPNEAP